MDSIRVFFQSLIPGISDLNDFDEFLSEWDINKRTRPKGLFI